MAYVRGRLGEAALKVGHRLCIVLALGGKGELLTVYTKHISERSAQVGDLAFDEERVPILTDNTDPVFTAFVRVLREVSWLSILAPTVALERHIPPFTSNL